MFTQVKKHIRDGKSHIGVEFIEQNDTISLYITKLISKKNELQPEFSKKINHFNELKIPLKKGTFIHLVVNSDHVITKMIDARDTSNDVAVHSAFPNIQLQDFYYELTTVNDCLLVSICRKDYVASIIRKFRSMAIEIIGFSLAYHSLKPLLQHLDNDPIQLSTIKIDQQNQRLLSVSESDKEVVYQVNGTAIKSSSILSFGAALINYLKQSNSVSNFENINRNYQKEFYAKRFFKLFSRAVSSIILVGLLLNFFAFNNYFNKANALEETARINQENREKLLQLSKGVDAKEKLVEDVVGSASSKSSMYIDAIATSIPKEILLSELNYQPLLKKIKKGKSIQTSLNTINVKGITYESEIFSKWIETIEKSSWIKRLEVEDYGYEGSNTSFFSVLITIKDE